MLTVYLVAGILFNKFHREQTGVDMVPNVDFWKSLPGLAKVSSYSETSLGPKFKCMAI